MEHNSQHGHIVRVPRVTQLIEYRVFEDGCEVVRVRPAEVPQTREEQRDGRLGLEPQLDQLDHHVHVRGRGRRAVQTDASQQLLSRSTTQHNDGILHGSHNKQF